MRTRLHAGERVLDVAGPDSLIIPGTYPEVVVTRQ